MAPDQPEPLLGIGDTAAAMGASRTAAEAYERALRLTDLVSFPGRGLGESNCSIGFSY